MNTSSGDLSEEDSRLLSGKDRIPGLLEGSTRTYSEVQPRSTVLE